MAQPLGDMSRQRGEAGDRQTEAYLLFERARWGRTVICPRCGSTGCSAHLAPADGVSRATRTGARTRRRVWRCARCRGHFSVLVGTVLSGTRVPLPVWTEVAVTVERRAALPTPADLVAAYAVTRETARHMSRVLEESLGDLALGDCAQRQSAVESGTEQPGERLLRRLLTLKPARVEQVRAAAAGRQRRLRQDGTSATYD